MARKYRKNSEFGDGKLVPLDRERVAAIRALLRMKAYNGPGKLTAVARLVCEKLLEMIGRGGRLCPSIETLATLLGKSRDAIQRGLNRLRQLGFLDWTRRLVRLGGGRVRQTSNAYHFRCEPGNQSVVLRSKNLLVPLAERDARARAESGSGATIQAAAAAQTLEEIAKRRKAARDAAWAGQRGWIWGASPG